MPKLQFMKLSTLSLSLAVFFGVSWDTAFAQSRTKQNNEGAEYSFACYRNPETGLPTTFAIRDGQPRGVGVPIIQWKSNYFRGWSPEKRCNTVSQRMQDLGPERLSLISNSWMNGEPVICAATDRSSRDQRCTNSRLIFTLESKDDFNKIRTDFESVLANGSSGAITRSGEKFYINMAQVVKNGKPVRLGERL